MRFDIRNYFKTGKTPYTAQFSEDFSTENFDGSVIREPVTGSFQAVPTADGVVMQLTIAAETDAECARCLTPIHQSYNFSVDCFLLGTAIFKHLLGEIQLSSCFNMLSRASAGAASSAGWQLHPAAFLLPQMGHRP